MNQSRRYILKLIPAIVMAPFCGALADETGQRIIRINIPGPGSLPFLPLELIPILGIDRGLNVQLIIRYFPSGVRALEDMLAGNAQFSAQGFTVLHSFQGTGRRVQAIASLSGQVPPFGIVVRSDLRQQITSVANLRGRSIGISIGNSISKTYMQHMAEIFLRTHDIRSDEVRWVATAQNMDGQLGALSSKSVDAVFCEEPFMSSLVRNKAGFVLSDFSQAGVMDRIPGAGHLRAALATSAENLAQDVRRSELMLDMLRQSLAWMGRAGAAQIASRLNITNRNEKAELANVLIKHPGMYAADVSFSQRQIEATAQFMRSAGIFADDRFDINTLIDSKIAGVRP